MTNFVNASSAGKQAEMPNYLSSRVSKTDTDSKKTDTDTIFPNYPGYTDNGYTDIY